MSDSQELDLTDRHARVIDAARLAIDFLQASELEPLQQQALVALINAMQDLNTLYWEKS